MEHTSHASAPVRIGDRVVVRCGRWTVSAIEREGSQAIVTLAACSHDTPTSLRVVTPADEVVCVATAGHPRVVGSSAWREAARQLLARSGTAARLRAAASARVALMPYQLEPALALLAGLGTRVLVADAVGLGKTVQALLAVAELRAAGAVRRVLVVCPAGLRDQWVSECAARLAIDARLLDQAGIRRSRTARPSDVNPWALDEIVVTSVDYVKRPEVLPLVLAAGWDAVVVDEAHGAAGRSERRQAVDAVCREAAYVLLLSATPHNGDDASFRSVCDLGSQADRLLVFRRTRADAGLPDRRRVHTLLVAASAAERVMHGALARFTQAIRREPAWREGHRWLLLTLLHKRACSSPFALAESAARRLRALEADHDTGAQLPLPLDDGGELDGTDEAPVWGRPALSDLSQERHILHAIVSAARLAAGHDSKLARLRRLLRRVREPVIVFTEYRDTLLHLQQEVVPQAAVIHGGLAREERANALAAFGRVGVLLATDAAGEGLNLHDTCRVVVNLELPWNPMRLEQRIGRVDRIGQRHRVHAFHLVSPAAGEMRLLQRLAARVGLADSRLGAPDPLGKSPIWSEDSAARHVLGLDMEDAATKGPPACHNAPESSSSPLIRRTHEAQVECARLLRWRTDGEPPRAAPTRDRPESVGSTSAWTRPVRLDDAPGGTLIGRLRHRRTRAALRDRTLVLVRSVLEDGTGRPVFVHVTPILLQTTGPALGHAAATRITEDVARASAEREAWASTCAAEWQRFVNARLARLQSIIASLSASGGLHQPGLFDRRAERLQAEAARAHGVRLAFLRGREADARVQAHTATSAPHAAVLLLPPWVELQP